jgi:excisionase family DNA binding protein
VPSVRDREPIPQQDGPLPTLVDIETVSRSFGISMRQVRRFVAEGTMPFVRVGHLIRFDTAELNKWIDARRYGSIGSR